MFLQNATHVADLDRLIFRVSIKTHVNCFHRISRKNRPVHEYGHVPVLKLQVAVAAVSNRAPDNLFQQVQIVPRVHDVHLAYIFQVQSL